MATDEPASLDNSASDNAVGGIQLGANGEELRYWKAKEALRHAEVRLVAQALIRAALEARATAITGWAAAGLLAAAGAGFANSDVTTQLASAIAGALLLYVAFIGIYAVRPRN